jgi:hypothetical protein
MDHHCRSSSRDYAQFKPKHVFVVQRISINISQPNLAPTSSLTIVIASTPANHRKYSDHMFPAAGRSRRPFAWTNLRWVLRPCLTNLAYMSNVVWPVNEPVTRYLCWHRCHDLVSLRYVRSRGEPRSYGVPHDRGSY